MKSELGRAISESIKARLYAYTFKGIWQMEKEIISSIDFILSTWRQVGYGARAMSTNSCKPTNDKRWMTSQSPVTSHKSPKTKSIVSSNPRHNRTSVPARASDKTKSTPSPAGGDQQRAVADLAWGFIGSFSPTRGILCLFCVLLFFGERQMGWFLLRL